MQWSNGVVEPHFRRFARSACSQLSRPLIILADAIALKLTDQFEGSLIRVFRRLGELLRQMAQAAKVIGNAELKEKFEKASEMLERPNSVIFCSSLYL